MSQSVTVRGDWREGVVARIAMALAAAAVAAPVSAPSARDGAAEPAHVRLEVFADHRSVGPGESFRVAIVQRIDRSWHTYWTNPGDAGVATQITWSVPQGYSIGPAAWPVPAVFRAGPLVTYGYAGEVVSLQELRAPPVLEAGTGVLVVDVKWLVCHESCIPGRATVRIALEQVVAGAGAADPAAKRRIDAAERRLPRDAPWPVSLSVEPSAVQLVIHGAARELGTLAPVRFLPLQWGQIDNAADQVADWSDGDLVLTLQRGDLRSEPIAAVEGLLVAAPARAGGAGRGYRVRTVATDPPAPQ